MFLWWFVILCHFLITLIPRAGRSTNGQTRACRVSLVIGVGHYTHIRRLDGAVEEAHAMAARPRDLRLGSDFIGPILDQLGDELIKALSMRGLRSRAVWRRPGRQVRERADQGRVEACGAMKRIVMPWVARGQLAFCASNGTGRSSCDS